MNTEEWTTKWILKNEWLNEYYRMNDLINTKEWITKWILTNELLNEY